MHPETPQASINQVTPQASINQVTPQASINQVTPQASINQVTPQASINQVTPQASIHRATPAASINQFFEFSLLGLVATGFLALAGSGFLDRPTLLLTILGLLLRAGMVAGVVRFRIAPAVVSGLALAYVLFFPIDLWLISRDFLTVTVHGVCFLAIVRILTAQSNRDHLYTGAISFIELISAALLSVQPGFFLWLAIYVVFAIAALTSAEMKRALARSGNNGPVSPSIRPDLNWRLGVLALGSACGMLLITAVLFLLVPRTARMAARVLPRSPRLTGFSNVVNLGGFGRISRDDRPVLYVLSYSRRLPDGLRWRGTALSRFDGRRWFEPPLPGREVPTQRGTATVADEWQRSRRDGRRLLYRVDVQNSGTNTLFVAGIPEFVNIDAPRLFLTQEDSLRVPLPPAETLRYEVSAHSGQPIGWPLSRAERSRYLQLPRIDPRIQPLAHGWAGEGGAMDRALAIERHLRHDFRYVLDGPPRPVSDPLADFLFVRREGYCEYFASAMAVMLRTENIPARVATGFVNGYYNDVSGLTVLRASDAHAWVEAWIEGRGWTTFDPTPAGSQPSGTGLLSRLGMYSDALDHAWREWVVSYDLSQQVAMAARFEGALRGLKSIEDGSRTRWSAVWKAAWKQWGWWALAGIGLVFLAALAGPRIWKRWRRNAHLERIRKGGGSPADASVLYDRMLEGLRRRGMDKPAAATPLEFARRLPAGERAWVMEFTAVYNASRFGADAQGAARLAAMIAEREGRKRNQASFEEVTL